MTDPFWWQGEHEGVRLAFTSAEAGNLGTHVGDPEEALANRSRLERTTGRLSFLNQVHSADVLDAGERHDDAPTGDAWVSGDASAPLGILVADCLPVLLVGAGAEGAVTAAAHAGRVGLLGGVLESTVTAMEARGAAGIRAWIGPAACGRCYEVPQEMVDEVAEERPALVSVTSWGTPALNLRAEASAVLSSRGVEVHDVGGCTIEDPALFSHRRSQQQGSPAGRIAGLVWKP